MFSLINLYGTRSLLQKSCMPSSLFFDICHFNSRFPIIFLSRSSTAAAYVPSLCVLIFAERCEWGATFVVTSKTEFEERRRLSSVAFWPSLTKAALWNSHLSSPPPRSSSHIFQNTLSWTRTEKKQTSNWIKTNVSLWKKKPHNPKKSNSNLNSISISKKSNVENFYTGKNYFWILLQEINLYGKILIWRF